MDPSHLYNDVFWTEPQFAHDNISEETNEYKQHQEYLKAIANINKCHISEINGEGTSRIPLIKNPEKLNIENCFKCY